MDWVAPGVVLAGKYALEKKLGQGGMGAVWRAEHMQLRSPVAIKLIDEQIASSPDALARFMREAQSAAALRSPHVVQILDFGADRGVPYIAMELLEGESLADRLARVGRMPPQEIAQLITQVSRALAKAHEMGIVHRDIKPDNIFIVRNDEEDVAKVLDFGIAKSSKGLGVGSGSTTRTGAILGTPNYMSPEQAEGTKLVDHRTDLWALGVIVFEALVGRKPFDSDALGSLLLAICTRPIPIPSQWGCQFPGFDAWFARACAREVGERFQSARELAASLRQLCGITDVREPALSAHGPTVRAVSTAQMTPFSQSGHGAPNPPLPTANTYSASVNLGTKRKPITALVIVGLFASAAMAAGVAFFVHRGNVEVGQELTAKSAEPASVPASKAVEAPVAAPVVQVPAPAPTPVVAPALSTPASDAPAASAAPAPAPPTVAAGPGRRPKSPPPAKKPASKLATPASPPTPGPAPAPAPAPEPKREPSNKVNLGI